MCCKILRSRFIFSSVGVLVAIELDNQLCFEATEIGNVWPNWELTAKLRVVQMPATQMEPQLGFDIGQLPPEPACVYDAARKLRNHRLRPLPNPSPILSPRERERAWRSLA